MWEITPSFVLTTFLLRQWGQLDGDPELFQPNCMTPGEANEADQEAWYESEHIPLFREIDGWLMSRRYRVSSLFHLASLIAYISTEVG